VHQPGVAQQSITPDAWLRREKLGVISCSARVAEHILVLLSTDEFGRWTTIAPGQSRHFCKRILSKYA